MTESKNDIIKKIYLKDFGNMQEILKDAKEFDPTITYNDVKQWKETSTERTTNLRAYNSYISPEPLYEFQIDGFEYTFHQKEFQNKKLTGKQTNPITKYGLLFVDSFTKFTYVVPVEKTTPIII